MAFYAKVEVTIDSSAVGPYLDSKGDAIREALLRRMQIVSEMLQKKILGKLGDDPIKQRTGKLATSVRVIPPEDTGDEIEGGVQSGGGPAYYARMLESGTEAHDIVPVTKQALQFFIDGKELFRKRVHHPGTKAYKFMSETLEENADNIIGEFKDAVKEATEE